MTDPVKTWYKMGLILTPQPDLWWWRTHCMAPTPNMLEGSLCQVYFSGRDEHNRSHIGRATLDLDRDGMVVEISENPVLSPGALGCFDDNGVTPSCIIEINGCVFLYYIGWNPGSTTRMNIFGGLAISKDGGKTFERWSQAPIIERCRTDPYINTAPFVIEDGSGYRMYYVSGVGWDTPDNPRYLIKTATSDNGTHWQRDGIVCIDFAGPDEVALARPFVVKEDNLYRMWFAHKGVDYRLGYAESKDGQSWKRKIEPSGLDVSEDGFDSTMMEYAVVVRHAGRRFMFYNGNDYGRHGFGLAVET